MFIWGYGHCPYSVRVPDEPFFCAVRSFRVVGRTPHGQNSKSGGTSSPDLFTSVKPSPSRLPHTSRMAPNDTLESGAHTVTVKQFATMSGLTPLRVRRLVKRGSLPAVRLPGSRLWLIELHRLWVQTNAPQAKANAPQGEQVPT